MKYEEIGKHAESLMTEIVKGEIDEKEFVQSIYDKLDAMKVFEGILVCEKCNEKDDEYLVETKHLNGIKTRERLCEECFQIDSNE